MSDDEMIRQPERVNEVVRNYLGMTLPRDRRREPPERRRPIDNEGLLLDEGNDFA